MSASVTLKDLLKLTVQITSGYFKKTQTPLENLPKLFHKVFCDLANEENQSFEKLTLSPSVPIEHSVTDAYIICLEDGKKVQLLKPHLKTVYQMSVAEYKQRWGLSFDYPVVAPNYAKRRSQIAIEMKLGTIQHKRRSEKHSV